MLLASVASLPIDNMWKVVFFFLGIADLVFFNRFAR